MILSRDLLSSKSLIEKKYALPQYDWKQVYKKSYTSPEWVHFGAGNIFRAFLASVSQELLNDGRASTGVIAVEGYDYEIIDTSYTPYDNLTLLAILNSDRTIEKSILSSITEALKADRNEIQHWERLEEIFCAPSLKMASFTITEKGYSLTDANGNFRSDILADFDAGPEHTNSYIGKVASLLYTRFLAGKLPLAMVSMDNCSANGEKLENAIQTFAAEWQKRGLVPPEFLSYICSPETISFPWTMIDKITPRPDESVLQMFRDDGFEDITPKVTTKNTFVAPSVNAEKTQYLIIEDHFPNGRPDIAGTGVMFTDRTHVAMVERMKVTTCLNPLHTALAVYGCLLGYSLLSQEMQDEDLKKLVYRLGYDEGLPVVTHPEILDPKTFLSEVLEDRIPNPFLPDTPQRIATDTSQKLAIRFGETIREYQKRNLDINHLVAVSLVLAGWLRYLLEVDDHGQPFTASADPMRDHLRDILAPITLGCEKNVHDILAPLLSDEKLFGVNLYEAGLGTYIEQLFEKMIAGPGAVRTVLRETLQNL